MSYINDEVFDGGLDYADTNGTRVDVCSAAPTSNLYANIAAVSLGNKTGLNVTAPANGDTDGRKVTIPAIVAGDPGDVTADGTVSHWVLSDGAAILVAWGTISNGQAVVNGNTFTLAETSITIRDPA